MFVVLVTTFVLLCSQVGNAAVFVRHEVDLQAHGLVGSREPTHHVEFSLNSVGRINGLGVYEPPSAKPLPIVHKLKTSSKGSSLPSNVHWTEIPEMPKQTNGKQPAFPKSFPALFTRPEIMKKQKIPSQQVQKKMKKMGIELTIDHVNGQYKASISSPHLPNSRRPLLQGATPSFAPSAAPTVAPSMAPAVVTSASAMPSIQNSKTMQPTAMPTTNFQFQNTSGPITTGYAVLYATFDVSDTKCASTPTGAYLSPLGVCIANGDGSGLMYSADAKKNIYMSYYATYKCNAADYFGTLFVGATLCGSCGGGDGCAGMFYYSPTAPSWSTGDYMVISTYQNSTLKASCSVTASSQWISQGYCAKSPCSLSLDAPPTDDPTSAMMPMMPVTTKIDCPNAIPDGTITSGYAISSATYAATDSSCSTTPTSVTYTPLGVCFQDISSDGVTILGSFMLKADASNNVFWFYYDFSATGTNKCSGNPTVTTIPKQACGCYSDGCYQGYYASTSLPTVGSGTSQTTSFFNTPTCGDVGGSPYITISQVPSGTACQASTCQAYSDGGGAYSSTCSGSTLAPVGSITSGWAIMSISYGATDTTCVNPTQAVMYPLGTCLATYGTSSGSAPTGGMQLTADSNNALYMSIYSSVTCTAPYLTSYQLPVSQQACTFNPKTDYAPASYSESYFYYATIPVPPASVGSFATVKVYSGATCTGTPTTVVLQQTTAANPCTKVTCLPSGNSAVSIDCSGTAVSTTATITSGWAVANATFALADSKCAATPTSATLYKLGYCIPSFSSSAVTAPDNGVMLTSDTSGVISMATYSDVTCKTTTGTSAIAKVPCGCINMVGKTCIDTADPTVGAYSNSAYYASSVPTVNGLVMTVTAYDNCASAKAYNVNIQTSPYCYVQACTCDTTGFCYASTCTGTSKGTITSGYYIASMTFDKMDTKCANPLDAVYYPLGVCIPSSGTGVIYKADAAGNTYSTYYNDEKCKTTPVAYYQPPNGNCQVTDTGRETTNGYSNTVPNFGGAPVQTVTYYTGATCATGSIQSVFSFVVAAGDCSPSGCNPSKLGTYSYQYSCPGTKPASPGLPGGPSMAPTKAGVTMAPTAENIKSYDVELELYGLSKADFAKQDSDGKLTLALQQQIASASGITDLSSIAITGVNTGRRARMLQAQGSAPPKATAVSSTVKDKKGKITSAASLGTKMAAASDTITGSTKQFGVTGAKPAVTVIVPTAVPTKAPAPTAAPSVAGTTKKSAATTTVSISEITTYTTALLVGLVLAMMA